MAAQHFTDGAWRQRTWLLIGLAAAMVLATALVKPIAQPLAYRLAEARQINKVVDTKALFARPGVRVRPRRRAAPGCRATLMA